MPIFKPLRTWYVWWLLDSITISLNQLYKQKIKNNKATSIVIKPGFLLRSIITKPKINCNTANEVKKGQGLFSTKWNGCCSFFISIIDFIFSKDFNFLRVTGLEPVYFAWKAKILTIKLHSQIYFYKLDLVKVNYVFI